MRLLVTGSTGFIGSHFVRQALAAGHDVIGQRRSVQSRPRIPLAVDPLWLTRSLDDLSVGDFAGVDVVAHLAAHTANVPYDTLENCLYHNLTVPLRMFDRAASAGVRRFVVAGSCFEYGRSGERYEFIPVGAPLEPTQTYPASKAAAGIAFYQLAVERRLQLSYHRIFQVFGEGEAAGRLWPSLRRAAEVGADFPMTKGDQLRDFIPVEEVARQLLSACFWEDCQPGVPIIKNLGTGRPQSLAGFASHWWQSWGARGDLRLGELPYRSGEVMRYVPLV